jgi:hypothetical protein
VHDDDAGHGANQRAHDVQPHVPAHAPGHQWYRNESYTAHERCTHTHKDERKREWEQYRG